MKIDYAINSSDDSPYLDYWETVKNGWNRIGIKPVLIRITNEVGFKKLNTEDCVEIILKPIDGIKISLQAQIARIWAYKLLSGNCIMSDIDMMPVSSEYFNGIASKYNEDEIVSYCSDAAERFDGYHPMCYVLANNNIMSVLIKHNTWEEFCTDLAEKGGHGWSTDQWHLTQLIKDYPKLVSLKRGWNSAGCADNRLDRIGWNYTVEQAKKFYDAHLPKPYKENKELIDNFIKNI